MNILNVFLALGISLVPATIFVVGLMAVKHYNKINIAARAVLNMLRSQRFVAVYMGLGLSIMANNINDIIKWKVAAMNANAIPIILGIMLVALALYFWRD